MSLFGLQACFSPGASAEEAQSLPSTIKRLEDSGCLAASPADVSASQLGQAIANCPPVDPVIRIETGDNTAKINHLAADASCTVIATASEDKTARVYRGDGRLLSVLRPPIGPGNGGKLRAVAVSPDGRLVAVGGWDVALARNALPSPPGATSDHGLYIFDPSNGALIKRIGNFPYDLKAVAFSPDGQRLAVGLGGNVYVFETEHFTEVFHDGGLQDIPYAVAFGPGHTLYVASLDGRIRKYDGKGRVLIVKQFRQLGRILSLIVAPGGDFIGVTSLDVPGVYFLDAARFKTIGALQLTALSNAPVGLLAATSDGHVAGGGIFVNMLTRTATVRIWGPAQDYHDVSFRDDSVGAISACGSDFLIATAGQTLSLVDALGNTRWRKTSANYDAHGKLGRAFLASKDGQRIWFGLGLGAEDPVEFDLANERLYRNPVPEEDLFPPIDNLLPVTGWNVSGDPRLGGKSVPHENDEMFRSLAERPDASGFVLGSEFQVWMYDRAGNVLWQHKPPAPAFGVNISQDGRLLMAAYGDGTIRWHRLTDGAELLALYVDRKSLAWIAWTPTGYFMASPGGDALAGWHLNRGQQKAADFFPMSRFRDHFYRPDIVKLVLAKLDEGAAIEAANAVSQGKPAPLHPDLPELLPPVISITSPADGSRAQPGSVSIGYDLRSPSGLPADAVSVLFDGRPTGIRQTLPATFPSSATVHGQIEVQLPNGASGPIEIGLVAKAGNRRSVVAKVHLNVAAAPTPDDLLKPKLFALVVGISKYQMPGIKPLHFASKDATDFQSLLKRQENGIYGHVEVRTLTDEDARTGKIKEDLAWLTDQVTRHDVGVVYLAGHGETDSRNRFWFLTSDTDAAHVAATALSKEDIDVTLEALRGRVIVFLDACHSGRAVSGPVDTNALVSDFAVSGQDMVIFSSSSGREVSYESPDWNNGVFTKAIIEAIAEGKADLFKTGRITSSLLDAYATKRVGDLTGGHQHPLMYRPQQYADFDIAEVR